MVIFKYTISKLGELQEHPRIVGAKNYTILGQFAAKFISIPPQKNKNEIFFCGVGIKTFND